MLHDAVEQDVDQRTALHGGFLQPGLRNPERGLPQFRLGNLQSLQRFFPSRLAGIDHRRPIDLFSYLNGLPFDPSPGDIGPRGDVMDEFPDRVGVPQWPLYGHLRRYTIERLPYRRPMPRLAVKRAP